MTTAHLGAHATRRVGAPARARARSAAAPARRVAERRLREPGVEHRPVVGRSVAGRGPTPCASMPPSQAAARSHAGTVRLTVTTALDLDHRTSPTLTAALVDVAVGEPARGTALADAVEAALRDVPHLRVDRDGDAVVARTSLGPRRARRDRRAHRHRARGGQPAARGGPTGSCTGLGIVRHEGRRRRRAAARRQRSPSRPAT